MVMIWFGTNPSLLLGKGGTLRLLWITMSSFDNKTLHKRFVLLVFTAVPTSLTADLVAFSRYTSVLPFT
jgi:hypothetical protein